MFGYLVKLKKGGDLRKLIVEIEIHGVMGDSMGTYLNSDFIPEFVIGTALRHYQSGDPVAASGYHIALFQRDQEPIAT